MIVCILVRYNLAKNLIVVFVLIGSLKEFTLALQNLIIYNKVLAHSQHRTHDRILRAGINMEGVVKVLLAFLVCLSGPDVKTECITGHSN